MAELATIARPYAEALYKAAGDAGAAQTQQWLDVFAAVAADPEVLRVAQSPKVGQGDVMALFGSVSKLELPALAHNFLKVVVENGRLAALPQVAQQFRALSNARLGVADAVVYSAFPLSEAQLQELRPSLEQRFARKLNLSVELDESLIGGVRVVVGDEEFDASVKARLEQMKAVLTA
ncbi:MAG: F0F1 ATP synthase subunit delta [Comamonadaceae bacterium]|nr:F0F1 ATP synthase subunit delta [Comamonadaceae bacterium]